MWCMMDISQHYMIQFGPKAWKYHKDYQSLRLYPHLGKYMLRYGYLTHTSQNKLSILIILEYIQDLELCHMQLDYMRYMIHYCRY